MIVCPSCNAEVKVLKQHIFEVHAKIPQDLWSCGICSLQTGSFDAAVEHCLGSGHAVDRLWKGAHRPAALLLALRHLAAPPPVKHERSYMEDEDGLADYHPDTPQKADKAFTPSLDEALQLEQTTQGDDYIRELTKNRKRPCSKCARVVVVLGRFGDVGIQNLRAHGLSEQHAFVSDYHDAFRCLKCNLFSSRTMGEIQAHFIKSHGVLYREEASILGISDECKAELQQELSVCFNYPELEEISRRLRNLRRAMKKDKGLANPTNSLLCLKCNKRLHCVEPSFSMKVGALRTHVLCPRHPFTAPYPILKCKFNDDCLPFCGVQEVEIQKTRCECNLEKLQAVDHAKAIHADDLLTIKGTYNSTKVYVALPAAEEAVAEELEACFRLSEVKQRLREQRLLVFRGAKAAPPRRGTEPRNRPADPTDRGAYCEKCNRNVVAFTHNGEFSLKLLHDHVLSKLHGSPILLFWLDTQTPLMGDHKWTGLAGLECRLCAGRVFERSGALVTHWRTSHSYRSYLLDPAKMLHISKNAQAVLAAETKLSFHLDELQQRAVAFQAGTTESESKKTMSDMVLCRKCGRLVHGIVGRKGRIKHPTFLYHVLSVNHNYQGGPTAFSCKLCNEYDGPSVGDVNAHFRTAHSTVTYGLQKAIAYPKETLAALEVEIEDCFDYKKLAATAELDFRMRLMREKVSRRLQDTGLSADETVECSKCPVEVPCNVYSKTGVRRDLRRLAEHSRAHYNKEGKVGSIWTELLYCFPVVEDWVKTKPTIGATLRRRSLASVNSRLDTSSLNLTSDLTDMEMDVSHCA